MQVIQRTTTGTSIYPIETRAFENRTLWVQGEVNEQTAAEFIKSVIELNRISTSDPIKVIVMSPGGSVIHGLAMYDAIRTSLAPVETYCVGTAYSMGAILFVAGAKRYILEHSKVMLHEPLIGGGGASGSASSIKSLSDSLQNTKNQLNEILCRHTGKTLEEMEKATDHDNYFTAQEAIEFGLADEIVGLDRIV